jgi:hypothetical protein
LTCCLNLSLSVALFWLIPQWAHHWKLLLTFLYGLSPLCLCIHHVLIRHQWNISWARGVARIEYKDQGRRKKHIAVRFLLCRLRGTLLSTHPATDILIISLTLSQQWVPIYAI